MKFLGNISNLLGLNIEEPWLTAIIVLSILLAIVGFINLLFKTITRGKEFFSSIVNIVLFIIIAITLYGLGSLKKDKPLEILLFETDEPYYSPTDEIFFHVKTNKKAFLYIYSFNKNEKRVRSFPKNSKNNNLIPANAIREIGDGLHFSQSDSDFAHDQKVILVASTRPKHELKEVMTPESFSKMVEDSANTKMYAIADKEEIVSRILNIHIENNLAKVKIELDNIISKQGEPLYIDATSSVNGYLTVFEGVPNNLHRIEGGKVRSDDTFRTQVDSLSLPLGEHIVVAIYTPKKERLTTDDFKVETQDKKGGKSYTLKFRDTSYPYAIRTHKVIK